MCHGKQKQKYIPKKGKSSHSNAIPYSRTVKHGSKTNYYNDDNDE